MTINDKSSTKRCKILKKLVIILMVLVFLSLSISAAAFEINIAAEVEVSSPQITLGEIAEIKAPDLSAAAVEKLENLSFKSSPNPGYSKRLSRVLVDLTIKNQGYTNEDFRLQMPNTIMVNRKSNIIKEAEISNLVESYLKSKLNFRDAQIIIESRSSVKDLKVAAGNYELEIAEQQNLSLPNTNLKLEVWQNGDKIRTLFYPVKVNLVLDVLTADENLNSNSKLKKSDFKIEEKTISGDPEEIVRDYSDLNFNNITLSRSLKKGEPLKENYLKIPYAVKWGQKLNLKVNVNNIQISTFVEAKERGKIGEIITVENLDSGYEFQVLVVSPTEVKMISE